MKIPPAKRIFCSISTLGQAYVEEATGKASQTYRIRYANELSLGETADRQPEPLSKDLAKAIHGEVRRRLPIELNLAVR